MTKLRSAAIVGVQQPRVRSVPAYDYSDGDAAIELAASAGLELDPWEADCLRDAMGVRVGDVDRWAALEVGIIVGRQNGKGTILEARELAGLYLDWLPERLILHSAHEFKTAREAFLRITSLIDGSDELRSRVKQIRTSHGEEGIQLQNGRRLQFVARSTSSGRGFTGDVVVLDEAFALTDEMIGAMFPTISARTVLGNPQIWYTSSAGGPLSWTLGRVRQRGHDAANGGEQGRLCYLEWSSEADADLDDERAWAAANPGLGIRISIDAIRIEREAMSDETFARERMGIWPESGDIAAISAVDWEAACHADVQAQRKGAEFGVDIVPDQSAASIAAFGGEIGELVEHRPGTGWLLDRLVELHSKYKGPVVIDGGGPAAFLIPALESRRVKIRKLSAAEVYSACGRIYEAIADSKLIVRANVELDEAVQLLRKKSVSGDRFSWRRDVGDVSAMFALTLAFGPSKPKRAEPFVLFG